MDGENFVSYPRVPTIVFSKQTYQDMLISFSAYKKLSKLPDLEKYEQEDPWNRERFIFSFNAASWD
jgi:hypothetical protein